MQVAHPHKVPDDLFKRSDIFISIQAEIMRMPPQMVTGTGFCRPRKPCLDGMDMRRVHPCQPANTGPEKLACRDIAGHAGGWHIGLVAQKPGVRIHQANTPAQQGLLLTGSRLVGPGRRVATISNNAVLMANLRKRSINPIFK